MKISASQNGIGLIEVLVSLLILAVTVLGFAGLQLRAVKASGEAQFSVQATAIVEDLKARMAINSSDAAMGYYRDPNRWTNNPMPSPSSACVAGACTTLQMAAFDVAEATYSAQTLLPNGMVRVEACQNPVAQTCIYVSWGGTKPTAGADGECVNADGALISNANCVVWPK